MTEQTIHSQVAQYLKLQYPRIIFNTDMSGIKLSIGAAKKAAQLRSKHKFPDLVIYLQNHLYSGLFLELKKDGEKLCKLNGEYRTPHLKAQAETLNALRMQGYKAEFAIGFEAAKIIIDNYINL